jgi:hypothetical protein
MKNSRLKPLLRTAKKVETPLTPMPRSLCAVRTEAMQPSPPQSIASPIRAGPRASRAAARRHHRCVSVGVAMHCNVAGYARGVSWCGLAPVCNDVKGRCWSGNRTRDSRINSPMLYPTELSSGGRTGFEPVANGLRRCSTSELSSARGTPSPDPRHTPRQCRAHRTGNKPAPLGIVHRCSTLAPRRKRQSVCDCIRLPPVPKHPGTAHPCAFAGFPASGQQEPGCFGSAMQSRFDRVDFLFANAKNKTPPGAGTRGRSRGLGRSG